MRSLHRNFATRAPNKQETGVTNPINLILNPRDRESWTSRHCGTRILLPILQSPSANRSIFTLPLGPFCTLLE
jgi:hypothetical protein